MEGNRGKVMHIFHSWKLVQAFDWVDVSNGSRSRKVAALGYECAHCLRRKVVHKYPFGWWEDLAVPWGTQKDIIEWLNVEERNNEFNHRTD
jgi:hypothetical protein